MDVLDMAAQVSTKAHCVISPQICVTKIEMDLESRNLLQELGVGRDRIKRGLEVFKNKGEPVGCGHGCKGFKGLDI
ncbi:unnamed protein product [marine sediment metagenome]|uniref:Uncharacterized protein n=1 Tax=marine sediment metagenome TaxID=412755 RepID=X1FBF1_9ZZZZ